MYYLQNVLRFLLAGIGQVLLDFCGFFGGFFFLYNFFFPNSQLRAPLPRSCSILAASRGPGYTSGGYCISGISIHCLVLARVGRLLRKVVFKAAGRTNEWSPMAQKSAPLFANQQLLSRPEIRDRSIAFFFFFYLLNLERMHSQCFSVLQKDYSVPAHPSSLLLHPRQGPE